MLKKILIGFVVLVVVFCGFVATRPSEFNVSRTATIKAPPANVFAVVNNFKRWDEWSPWAKLDPKMKATFEGPEEGVGAVYHWDGNNEVGAGTNRLIESKPHERIKMELTFTRPMAGKADVTFTFVPEGEATKVTWAMASTNDFMGKLVSVFMDCEKMCGDQFNEGFENLRKVVEAPAAKP